MDVFIRSLFFFSVSLNPPKERIPASFFFLELSTILCVAAKVKIGKLEHVKRSCWRKRRLRITSSRLGSACGLCLCLKEAFEDLKQTDNKK